VSILGGGFGGLYAATALCAADVPEEALEVTLISDTNHFTFTPLLAEVVGGSLGQEHVTFPYRVLARRYGFHFRLGRVEGLDPGAGVVHTTAGEVPFDYAIVALGAGPRYFGNEELARTTLPLTSVSDAVAIRTRVLAHAELAAQESRAERRRSLLTFVVAGAGPAGVEAASEIWHLLKHVLPRYYELGDDARVVLIEGGEGILNGWDPALARNGLEALRRRGIEVRLATRVGGYDGTVVRASGPDGDGSFEAGSLIWTAGMSPATVPLAETSIELGPIGHVQVDPFLRANGRECVFAVGDAASRINPRTERPFPPVAPIAISQGVRAAANVENLIMGRELEPYQAHHAGKIISLGNGLAFVDLLGLRFSGRPAWAIYRTAYLLKLVGLQNKVRAGMTLLLNRIFERDLSYVE